ncbi:MAG: hypothetical protein LBH62_09285 [Nitrososphaerota archaeon]|nr:hypothetical protein [Nitrososphaerota archaeon]
MSKTPEQEAKENFIKQIESALKARKGLEDFIAVDYDAGFNYNLVYGTSVLYNDATLRTIDTLLSKNRADRYELTVGFAKLYKDIMDNSVYALSPDDEDELEKHDGKAKRYIEKIREEWEAAGMIRPEPGTNYLQFIFIVLNKDYPEYETNPQKYPWLSGVFKALMDYKIAGAWGYKQRDIITKNNQRLLHAADNIANPGNKNGGQVIDVEKYYAGFTPRDWPKTSDLVRDLENSDSSVAIKISVDSFKGDRADIKIATEQSVNLPLKNIFSFKIGGHASEEYTLARYKTENTKVTMEIKYKGITKFATTPSELTVNADAGWYDTGILKDIKMKTEIKGTGYRLNTGWRTVDQLFGGTNPEFVRLKTFVISQEYTMSAKFEKINVAKFEQDFKGSVGVNLSLLNGIFSCGGKSTYASSDLQTDVKTEFAEIKFSPPPLVTSGDRQAKVCVLGGIAHYPP